VDAITGLLPTTTMHKLAAAMIGILVTCLGSRGSDVSSVVYLENWLRSPETAGVYAGPAPAFRYNQLLTEAIANRDRALVEVLFPLYRQALQFDRDLLTLEISLLRQSADAANEIAGQLEELIALLSERPAAGPASEIEREAISGVAGRFRLQSAQAAAAIPALERRLALLGGRSSDTADRKESPPVVSGEAATLAASSPLLRLFELMVERRVSPLTALAFQSEALQTTWSDLWPLPDPVMLRWGGRDPLSEKSRKEAIEADKTTLTEFIQRRLDSIAAWRQAEASVSSARLERMQAAAALAFRQYRQGAINISLLIEIQDAWFEALQARREALLQLWKEACELRSVTAS
jgi:hypothetical protein